ncbi:MAG: hypothetical protein CSA62_04510 [Planctomycetota bacterium]|nr:MAG: hypothetical protein CSA62_04510 [Planctomycetota bacterium]
MSSDTWAVLVRHWKENKKKCTLQPLLGDPRFRFETWKREREIEAEGMLLLEPGAPELSPADKDRPILLLDSTWRFLPAMRESLRGSFISRAIPSQLRTAYPRKAVLSEEPDGGLASIEALYLALRLLGRRDDTLLASYHWRQAFLAQVDAAGIG